MAKRESDLMYYDGERVSYPAFPMGGMGAGTICIEATGALNHVSVRHRPQLYHEPGMFSCLYTAGDEPRARLLEGPVQRWKVSGPRAGAGDGLGGTTYGLPRLAASSMTARFPFATVNFHQEGLPLSAEVTGWSPFVPGDADSASLPVAALEYRFRNTGSSTVDAIYSIHSPNFMRAADTGHGVEATDDGFRLSQDTLSDKPEAGGWFTVWTDESDAVVDHCWFRGDGFDTLSMLWLAISSGKMPANGVVGTERPSPGGSLYVPFSLGPEQDKTVRVYLSWYVPVSGLRVGYPAESGQALTTDSETYVPWYARRFRTADEVALYWKAHYEQLRSATLAFSDSFFASTLPEEAIEAAAANLSILKSPTVLRQADGRLWGWEGCHDDQGSCHGTCTHVWNYAQAICHLFPQLERSLRETEFMVSQDDQGRQDYRTPLPIGRGQHTPTPAADGQLGGLIKLYRDWRVFGDLAWLRSLWPAATQSLSYCMRTWDPHQKGVLEEPHHTTYDHEFWGPDGMCTAFYLAALQAMIHMGRALNEDVSQYQSVLARGRRALEEDLYNGEYFFQKVRWTDLEAMNAEGSDRQRAEGSEDASPELSALVAAEGPRYQYGSGCISDGVLGIWMAELSGISDVVDDERVKSHLRSVYRYNFRPSLANHANPQRPGYALGGEAGLLLCSWPKGGEPSLPVRYGKEVWTGIEYQVAAHLIMKGSVEEGLHIVRAARARYSGVARNPFAEYELGYWYARAMSSYALLQALSGIRYDAVEKILAVAPRVHGDFTTFLATNSGYALAGVREGQPFLDVRSGEIPVARIDYHPYTLERSS